MGQDQKSKKGTVSIIKNDSSYRLRWRYFGKRYSLSFSGNNNLGLIQVKKVALQIEQDVLLGNFDTTLLKYGKIKNGQNPQQITIVEHFENWVKSYKQMDCEVHTNYNSTRNMMRKWGKIGQTNILTLLNKETFCAKTYNRRLSILSQFCDWMVKQSIWVTNPLVGVKKRKTINSKDSKREPLTTEEIALILHTVKNDLASPKASRYKHSHYYPFLYFILSTGVRNAEAIGLRAGKVNLLENLITIDEVLARPLSGCSSKKRIRKQTKNGKVRQLPLSEELREVLIHIMKGKKDDDLVFLSPKGKAIDDKNFKDRIFKPVLKFLGIRERVLYACRHTFGSRCIDAGITPVMVAFLMGNNPETALRNYTHQLSIPKNLPKI